MPNRRLAAAFAGVALLGGCSRPALPPVPAPGANVCRVGPDGGPVGSLADKGIGGTGGTSIADRGIGGTGAPVLADRGIGGTGIIAVISGFASLCLAGQEVALPAETPILLGSEPSSLSQLRAGQVAIVEARDTGTGLSARTVTIRFEVSGPVETVAGDQLVVAGQRVATTVQTLGIRPAPGDWVAVSGIRREDGVIEATRLERRAPEPVVVHGVLRRDGGIFHIGTLLLTRIPAMDGLIGQTVTATGPLLIDRLATEAIAPDLLASDPASFFGPAVGVVLIEGYAELGRDRLRLGQGFAAPVAGPVRAGPQRGIYRFERGGAGFHAVDGGLGSGTENGRAAFAPAPLAGPRTEGFAPAPVPDRGISGGDGSFRRSDPGSGGPGGAGRTLPDPAGPGRAGPGRGH